MEKIRDFNNSDLPIQSFHCKYTLSKINLEKFTLNRMVITYFKFIYTYFDNLNQVTILKH